MSVVLDTSVLIDVLRADAAAIAYVQSVPEVPFSSELTRVEIARGLSSAERRAAEQLFQALRWIPVDEPIARRAGELGRRWDRHRPGIGVIDLVVAATAEELSAELATTNVHHFPMFAGLRLPYSPA